MREMSGAGWTFLFCGFPLFEQIKFLSLAVSEALIQVSRSQLLYCFKRNATKEKRQLYKIHKNLIAKLMVES